jgi:two-component system, NarL family, sensor histidine kinase DegS
MKQNSAGLSQRYVMALRKYLKPGPRTSLQSALRLGCQAVALGLETLELARIHEQALAALKLFRSKNGLAKRAEIFFIQVISLIAEKHRTAQNKTELKRLKGRLSRRTTELATGKRQLQRNGVRHKIMEDAAEKKKMCHDKCLEESLELQKRLRQLTHQVLAAQEDERKKISCELQDEIAQTLLGINVRLLSLKQENRSNTNGLKNEIASAQRLVAKSAKFVRTFARKLDNPNKAHSDQLIEVL